MNRGSARDRQKDPETYRSKEFQDSLKNKTGELRKKDEEDVQPKMSKAELESLSPEERQRLELRKKKFESVSIQQTTVSLKAIKERPKKHKKSKDLKTGNKLEKSGKKGSCEIDSEDSDKSGLQEFDEDSEDSDTGRSWREEENRQKVQPRLVGKPALVSLDQIFTKDSRKRDDRSKRSICLERPKVRRVGDVIQKSDRQNQKFDYHRSEIFARHQKTSSDKKTDIERSRPTSSVMRPISKPFPTDIPLAKLRVEVQVQPAERIKNKGKVEVPVTQMSTVASKRKVESDDDSLIDGKKVKKKKKKKEKKKKKQSKYVDEKIEEEQSSDESDRLQMEEKVEVAFNSSEDEEPCDIVLSAPVSEPTQSQRPSVLERLGKKVPLVHRKEKKKKKKKSNSKEGEHI